MKQKTQWVAVGAIVVVIAGLLGAGLALTPDLFLVAEGSKAPAFEATAIATGDTVSIEDYAGDVVLLNIWATWCGPCEREMPALQALHEELGPRGLQLVSVSIDDAIGPEEIQEWLEARDLTFPVLQEPTGRIERDYQTTGVPETFLIDRSGVIVRKVIGAADWDQPVQTAPIMRLLGISDTAPESAAADAAASPAVQDAN